MTYKHLEPKPKHRGGSENVYTVFDTETTGLFATRDIPEKGITKARDPLSYPEDYPRVFQLAFLRISESGEILESFSEFIKPDGWKIPNEKFWIEHGYSTEQCEELGVSMEEALNKFITSLHNSDYLVAHNLSYDKPVILSEISRYNMPYPEEFKLPDLLCTMKCTIDYVAADHSQENIKKYPWLKFNNKFPKLIELHEKLFHEGFDGAHDALVDVKATFRCLMRLKEMGIIKY